MKRRDFLKTAGALGMAAGGLPLTGCSAPPPAATRNLGRVVVIGGGFGGATTARYLRMWSNEAIEVMLVDREQQFVSCPLSNLVLGGSRSMENITRGYDSLRQRGVRVMGDEVTEIDPQKKRIRFAHRFADINYDRLVMAPGVDFLFDEIEGLTAEARKTVLHAWKAGPQTLALRRQLQAMRDGGTYVLGIPRAPYRCPSAPYERACQVAWYFKQAKPKSKVIILDANADVTSKPALFKAAWQELYPGMIEYRPSSEVKAVDAKAMTLRTGSGAVRGDVLNVLPPMRAGDIARSLGLAGANGRWCEVDWLSMASPVHKDVHVIGDAVLAAPSMSKSGHMANQHGKIAAAAIVEIMNGRQPDPAPQIADTCYSFVSDREAVHMASVHRYDTARRTLLPVAGAGGLSERRSDVEGLYALAWAQNIWSDMLG